MNVELTKEDVTFLELLLERELKTTLVEMHHTSHREYKAYVKEKETQIEGLITRLKNFH